MARVNIVKQIKIDGNWVLRSIPRKPSGTYDWTALSEGTYFIEWRDSGQRKREPAGITASQALEAQRKDDDLEAAARVVLGLQPDHPDAHARLERARAARRLREG